MARHDCKLRMDLRADGLRHAQGDAAEQRSPQRSHATDHHRLEREDQLRRAADRIEHRTDAEEEAAEGGDRDGDRRGSRVDAPTVDSTRSAAAAASAGGRMDPPARVLDRKNWRCPKSRTATNRT